MVLPVQSDTHPLSLQLLATTCGQLSGDGQLRDLKQPWLYDKALELPAPAPQAAVA